MREETGVPVLVVLDEFYQLGRLKVIQNAMSLARGYGLQLWPILQDLTQLQEHYEKSWETFLGNAGVRMFFAPREMTTAEYVSKLCGETTVTTTSTSKGTSENSGRGLFDGTTGKSEGTSTGVTQRRVKLPHEVFQIPGDQFWLFPETLLDATFIRGYRADYRTIGEFQGKYSPDPYHKQYPTEPEAADVSWVTPSRAEEAGNVAKTSPRRGADKNCRTNHTSSLTETMKKTDWWPLTCLRFMKGKYVAEAFWFSNRISRRQTGFPSDGAYTQQLTDVTSLPLPFDSYDMICGTTTPADALPGACRSYKETGQIDPLTDCCALVPFDPIDEYGSSRQKAGLNSASRLSRLA